MLTSHRYDGHDALAAAGSTAPGERSPDSQAPFAGRVMSSAAPV
jgi:hypothetical protein